jgi:cullin-4
MSEWETVKRPRLDSGADQDLIININEQQQQQQLPFSAFLSNSFRHNEKHPILSDNKLIVYDLKGNNVVDYSQERLDTDIIFLVERPDLPADYEENALDRLKFAIHAIQENQQSPESLEVLYQVSRANNKLYKRSLD